MRNTSAPAEPGTDEADVDAAIERLRADAASIRAAMQLRNEREQEAWRQYKEDVNQTLAAAEADLALSREALAARRAESRAALVASIDRARDAGRAWLDDMRVRGHLAELELQDLIGDHNGDGEPDLAELREAVVNAIARFRRSVARLIEGERQG